MYFFKVNCGFVCRNQTQRAFVAIVPLDAFGIISFFPAFGVLCRPALVSPRLEGKPHHSEVKRNT